MVKPSSFSGPVGVTPESVVKSDMRRLAASILIGLAIATTALAGESKEKGKDAAGQYVDVSPVALPIIVDGRLINYVFVSLRLNLAASASAPGIRDKEPFFRDALIHTAYRQPFVVPTNYTQVDVKALKARMMGEAALIVGPGVVTSVEIRGEPQAKRITGLPRPKGAPAAERAPIP